MLKSSAAIIKAPWRITLRDLLMVGVFLHLSVVVFMYPVRSMLLDHFIVRDVILWGCVLLGLMVLVDDAVKGITYTFSLLDGLVLVYLLYGGVVWLNGMYHAGLSFVESGTQVRDYFFPATIYFVVRLCCRTPRLHLLMMKFLLVVFLVNTGYLLFEFLAPRIPALDIDPHNLPWHQWFFVNGGRFDIVDFGSVGGVLVSSEGFSFAMGILGFPHYTAPLVVALFAFSWPVFQSRQESTPLLGSAGRLLAIPTLVIIGLTGIAVILMGVKTHMVSMVLLLALFPLLVQGRIQLRYVFILLGIFLLLLMNEEILLRMKALWEQVTVGNRMEGSRIEAIFRTNEFAYFFSLPLRDVLLGTGSIYLVETDFGAGLLFEIKMMVYALSYGLVWVLLLLGIIFTGLARAWKIRQSVAVTVAEGVFATGTIGLLLIYLIDLGHFGQTLVVPHFDLWLAVLAVISVIDERRRQQGKGRFIDTASGGQRRDPW